METPSPDFYQHHVLAPPELCFLQVRSKPELPSWRDPNLREQNRVKEVWKSDAQVPLGTPVLGQRPGVLSLIADQRRRSFVEAMGSEVLELLIAQNPHVFFRELTRTHA